MMVRIRIIKIYALSVCISLLIALLGLLCCEMFLRVFDLASPSSREALETEEILGILQKKSREVNFFMPDGALFWRLRPSTRIELGRGFVGTINSLGFRGKEISEGDVKSASPLILSVDDSCTFGWGSMMIRHIRPSSGRYLGNSIMQDLKIRSRSTAVFPAIPLLRV